MQSVVAAHRPADPRLTMTVARFPDREMCPARNRSFSTRLLARMDSDGSLCLPKVRRQPVEERIRDAAQCGQSRPRLRPTAGSARVTGLVIAFQRSAMLPCFNPTPTSRFRNGREIQRGSASLLCTAQKMSNTDSDSGPERAAEVLIDFAGVTSEQEVHGLFARSLHFPDFYGHNWDAFWDVLTGFACFPRRLVLSNTGHLRTAVPRAYEQLRSCFADCQREHPDIAPIVTWR